MLHVEQNHSCFEINGDSFVEHISLKGCCLCCLMIRFIILYQSVVFTLNYYNNYTCTYIFGKIVLFIRKYVDRAEPSLGISVQYQIK